ncbi:hypothetical protein AB6A40_001121 [Gnathostoma spinigerum]|uniref:Dynein heavy chain coiled coil stalk domain-containing protein n=1 Tax=Gnathostoma spinigerum TaxID=75299 RepID=A0ABD6E5K8_9BILA
MIIQRLNEVEEEEMCLRIFDNFKLEREIKRTADELLHILLRITMQTGIYDMNSHSSTRFLYFLANNFAKEYAEQSRMLNDFIDTLQRTEQTVDDILKLSKSGGTDSLEELQSKLSKSQDDLNILNADIEAEKTSLEDAQQAFSEEEKCYAEETKQCTLLLEEIENALKEPQMLYAEKYQRLLKQPNSEYKRLAGIKIPLLGTRLAVECVFHMVDPDFQPAKNSLGTWFLLQKHIDYHLRNKLLSFNAEKLTGVQIKILKKKITCREFKAAKIAGDSQLAAVMSEWIAAAFELAKISGELTLKKTVLQQLQLNRNDREDKIASLEKRIRESSQKLGELNGLKLGLEKMVQMNHQIVNYRQRGQSIISSLQESSHRFKLKLEELTGKRSNVFGNAILLSACKVFLLDLTTTQREESSPFSSLHLYLTDD